MELEVESQKDELKRAKEKVAEEEKNSKIIHEELAQIRKSKNKAKECLTTLKNKQPLPTKKEPGRKIIVMNSDLDKLHEEIKELEAMRDRIVSLSDHEKSRYNQLVKDARVENKELKKDLDFRDRVGHYSARN